MYRLTYFKLEIKKVFKTIGHMIGGAITLLFLIGVIAFSSIKLLYKDAVIGRITVAVVQKEEDALSNMAMEMIRSMDSVESYCDFVPMEEEEALEKLRNHQIFAALILPEKFVEGIRNGTNTPVTVILPREKGLESSLFQELTDAGAVMLGAGQAGIYAATDYCMEYNMRGSVEEVQDQLNRAYVGTVLSRSNYFKPISLKATGDLTSVQYYMIYGVILFFLLLGIPCALSFKKEPEALRNQLKASGITRFDYIAAKVVSIYLLLLVLGALFGSVALCIYFVTMGEWLIFSFQDILVLAGVILSVASLIVFVYQIAGSPVTGVMLLFIGTIFMIFCSGGFLPSVFLPESVNQLAKWLPATIWANQLSGILSGFHPLINTLKTIMVTLICYLFTSGMRREL